MTSNTPKITEIVGEAAPVRDAIAKAKKALRRNASEGAPTPERLAKAGTDARQDAVRAYHCEDAPIEKLAARCALAPGDTGKNRMLLDAAQRYYEHWYLSGMSGIGAIDLARGSGSSEGRPVGMPATELALHHRRKWRGAAEALAKFGKFFASVVDPVVLHEQEIEAIRYKVSGYRSAKQATAVTLDRLRGGLDLLALHFRTARLDAGAPRMQSSSHDSQSRPEGNSRALSRHRTLAGM